MERWKPFILLTYNVNLQKIYLLWSILQAYLTNEFFKSETQKYISQKEKCVGKIQFRKYWSNEI